MCCTLLTCPPAPRPRRSPTACPAGTGTYPVIKTLTKDELEAMVSRLSASKDR
jgi:hypothetical protein